MRFQSKVTITMTNMASTTNSVAPVQAKILRLRVMRHSPENSAPTLAR